MSLNIIILPWPLSNTVMFDNYLYKLYKYKILIINLIKYYKIKLLLGTLFLHFCPNDVGHY